MKIKRIISVITIVCMLVLTVNVSGFKEAKAADNTSIQLEYDQLTKYAGNTFTVSLMDNTKTVAGIELFISFDSDIFAVESITSLLSDSWEFDWAETSNGTYGSGIHCMLQDSDLAGFSDSAKELLEIEIDANKATAGNAYDFEIYVIDVCNEQGDSLKASVSGDVESITCINGDRESDEVKIVGYQFSVARHGLRVISTVEPEIDGVEVVEFGNIYGLVCDELKKSEMHVGSESKYVVSYAATSQGVSQAKYTDSDTAINYVRTMIENGTTAKAYNQGYYVRAYAKLADGSYVYSDVYEYSIYKVAKYLYDNSKMQNIDAHEYLRTNILNIVDGEYPDVDYNWGNTVVKQ